MEKASEKLTEQLTVKVSEEMANLVHRLACADGISAADLLRSLIEGHIAKKHDEYILLSKAFGGIGKPE